jgi:transcriptional regulator with GAF, ATPase, and Fis domain
MWNTFGQVSEQATALHGIIGTSRPLASVMSQLGAVAPTGSTILIQGKNWYGKEFVQLNCAAIPEGLIQSKLFGHEGGAFTGAQARPIGRFEAANGGTLPDEILADNASRHAVFASLS